ncbi:hypothetical protein EDD21DRAFT_46049 [Dissophora ornata]|nr:hypothetical protein EDD21DRAFT_46049 [Dissophora ornata]
MSRLILTSDSNLSAIDPKLELGPDFLALSVPAVPVIPTKPHMVELSTKRKHNDAILYDYGQSSTSITANQTVELVDALELTPIPFEDDLSIEQRALAHSLVAKKLIFCEFKIPTAVLEPSGNCTVCSVVSPDDLNNLFVLSPHASTLNERQYIRLNDTIFDILNTDWVCSPQLRFAC